MEGKTVATKNQLLFYQDIVALDRKKHQGLTLSTPIGLDFAASTNFIPVLLTELSEVAQELPVLFIPLANNEFALAAITGVQNGSNLLIQGGAWRGRYVPAFLRRYPFITLNNPEGQGQFTIAIDAAAPCLNSEASKSSGTEQHLIFEGDNLGKKLQELIPFLQKFHVDNQSTYAFCKRLHELNLLTESELAVMDKAGKKYQIQGAWFINEAALKALDQTVIQEFFANDWLQKIYQIHFSIKNFPIMLDRFATVGDSTKSAIAKKPVATPALAPKTAPAPVKAPKAAALESKKASPAKKAAPAKKPAPLKKPAAKVTQKVTQKAAPKKGSTTAKPGVKKKTAKK
jgi:hypothetical protein